MSPARIKRMEISIAGLSAVEKGGIERKEF